MIDDQWYRLGKCPVTYVHPTFSVTPSFCTVTYEYNWNLLPGETTATSVANQGELEFYYEDTSLDLNKSQLVTVTPRVGYYIQ